MPELTTEQIITTSGGVISGMAIGAAVGGVAGGVLGGALGLGAAAMTYRADRTLVSKGQRADTITKTGASASPRSTSTLGDASFTSRQRKSRTRG